MVPNSLHSTAIQHLLTVVTRGMLSNFEHLDKQGVTCDKGPILAGLLFYLYFTGVFLGGREKLNSSPILAICQHLNFVHKYPILLEKV